MAPRRRGKDRAGYRALTVQALDCLCEGAVAAQRLKLEESPVGSTFLFQVGVMNLMAILQDQDFLAGFLHVAQEVRAK